jgi:para-aminobenzoate synthetase/4-amino-4-deoxychorismate lyase
MSPVCFALFDDSSATTAAPQSRLYSELAATLLLHEATEFAPWLAQMAAGQSEGLFAVGLFNYELGVQLQGVTPHHAPGELGRILLFRQCQLLAADEVTAWLAAQAAEPGADQMPAGIAGVTTSVDEAGFSAAIEKIHALIEAGDTYQVNYTWRLNFAAFGSPLTLYRRLRARQPVPYGALIRLPDEQWILSLSPELLARHHTGHLCAEPMKGTAAASSDEAENARRATALAADPKNRAENLMIVDLWRNDFGRIARSGSVAVPTLFEVTRFGEVLQMTSTVTAELAPGMTLAQTLAALLPAGSVTGAPKKHTLEIINELETSPRGLYTGAIGWFDAPAASTSPDRLALHFLRVVASAPRRKYPWGADFCLSVPIRTLTLSAPDADGLRRGEMGVGAGIVHDSIAADEYRECWLKAQFLTALGHDFELFETMRASQDGIVLLDRHLARLATSARYFGFRCDEAALRRALAEACEKLPAEVPHRLRLALRFDGEIQIATAPLLPLPSAGQAVKLAISRTPLVADALFLRHKTSRRAYYDAAWRAAEALGAFDVLFCNARGELTEGARSSVFVKLSGRWHTPPLACGLLPGVMRAVILDDPAWAASERRLTRDDLRVAEEVVVCNALRGILPAVIDWEMKIG